MNQKHDELIAKEGWPFLVPLVLLTVISFSLGWWLAVSVVLLLLTAFVAYFFRNPYRQIPDDPAVIVSPADGKVVRIAKTDAGQWMVSIFLNVFNVHVNRAPIAGEVTAIDYKEGAFHNANHALASTENERNIVTISDGAFSMDVVQVAGLIARRIICWVAPSDALRCGDRFGLIRFGSRVDLFLPPQCEITVTKGQKLKGGKDIIGRRPVADLAAGAKTP